MVSDNISDKDLKCVDNSKLDILAAIPSFNEQDNIAFVAEQLGKGLLKFYPDKKTAVINCDNGSTDDTARVFSESNTGVDKLVLYEKRAGKGYAVKKLLKFIHKSKPKAIVIDDADLKSINPKWVKYQLDPIYDNYGFVTPYYSRYKYDGTITNHICYPLVYGLFCHDIRQPIGGDFAFSYEVAEHWLNVPWTRNAPLFGIDIFMTTNAILGGFKVCQVNLGAKIHRVKDPSKTLGPMFRQVISTLFKMIISNKDKLKTMTCVTDVPLLGGSKLKKPQQFEVDIEGIKKRFVDGYYESQAMIKKCVSDEDFNKIKACVIHDNVYIDDSWWAKLVYDFIIAYKKYERSSSLVLKAFIPLWFARNYSFIKDTIDMTTAQAEELILNQAKEFFRQRNYLLDRL